MLVELYIENLAIIEKAVINFDGGFNVFSGETGAGKSILIGGINAVLGERVYKDIVRSGAEKAVITALFRDIPEKICDILRQFGYDYDNDSGGELTLTREIGVTGNSTARINGRTATASQLKEIAADLIDVHGQHETRLITSKEVQLSLLDSFGNIDVSKYSAAFREFSAISKQLKRLQKENGIKNEKIEILTAKIADLAPYKLEKGEEAEVSAELNRLRNIQTISETLNRAYYSLNGDGESSSSAIDLLNNCKSALGDAAEFIPLCESLKERIDGVFIEIDDVKREIFALVSENRGAEKLPYYEERMSDFLRLRRKYSFGADELFDMAILWQSELDELLQGDETLQRLEAEKSRLGDQVKTLAAELTAKRKQTAVELSERICRELEYLDMPNTRLEFEISQEKVTINGMDSVEILIAVNKGETPKPLRKIASGGELSRIMLALKVVLAGDVPSMIFDEIDSGISGRAAHKVGLKLAELSKARQVLCVTHLAQIAAMADNHLLIEKGSENGRTFTQIKRVDGEERKKELARIISGDDDELSLANAERLLQKKTVM